MAPTAPFLCGREIAGPLIYCDPMQVSDGRGVLDYLQCRHNAPR